jgi:orotate phosphoribosyltransferase
MELGKRCNAVYVCPKEGHVRRGKMVAYAGKDTQGRNYVGDLYFNFRRIECHPEVVRAFAEEAWHRICRQQLLNTFDTVCGIPHGGRTFGHALALAAGKRFVYADKKPKPTESGKKQEYTWDLSQFELERGERVAVAEDVFNNFQNTDNTLEQIAATGADVRLLVGALNRSPIYDSSYTCMNGLYTGHSFSVVASIRQAYPEYEQDDPAVIGDVEAGNVEFEVKRNWARLCAAMKS